MPPLDDAPMDFVGGDHSGNVSMSHIKTRTHCNKAFSFAQISSEVARARSASAVSQEKVSDRLDMPWNVMQEELRQIEMTGGSTDSFAVVLRN